MNTRVNNALFSLDRHGERVLCRVPFPGLQASRQLRPSGPVRNAVSETAASSAEDPVSLADTRRLRQVSKVAAECACALRQWTEPLVPGLSNAALIAHTRLVAWSRPAQPVATDTDSIVVACIDMKTRTIGLYPSFSHMPPAAAFRILLALIHAARQRQPHRSAQAVAGYLEAAIGYFTEAGDAYAILTPDTPGPWINYMGIGQRLSGLITQTAGGTLWYRDVLKNRLLRYHQVGASLGGPGRYVYARDDESGEVFSPTGAPDRPWPETRCLRVPTRAGFSEHILGRCRLPFRYSHAHPAGGGRRF